MTRTAALARPQPARSRSMWALFPLVPLCLSPVAYLAGILFSDPLLAGRTQLTGADLIVVLGGDGPSRAQKASRLWLDGAAPQVLVTGSGDCMHIRAAMIGRGVDPQAIRTECRS